MDLGFDVVVTITGIVLVFLILVLLMAIITLEGKIFDSMNAKKKAAKTAAQAPAAKPAAAPVQQAAPAPQVEEGIPGDVVAAIMAAIHAMGNGKYTLKAVRRGKNGWGKAGVNDTTAPFSHRRKSMTQFIDTLVGIFQSSGFAQFGQPGGWLYAVMICVGCFLLYLAIVKEFEPLILLPMAFGMILANLPGSGIIHMQYFVGDGLEHPMWVEILNNGGLADMLYMGVKLGIYPPLIFLGIGTMTDFAPLISNPKSLLLGAAAQFGIFGTYMGARLLAATGLVDFTQKQSAAISIIGGADGPTAIFVTSRLAPELLGSIAVAAYSYMALVPVIQPPIMKALTTSKERSVVMKQLRTVSKTEKIIFPIMVAIIVSLIVPDAAVLVGMLMLGNLMKECGVVDRIQKTAGNELMNIITIFLALSVGCTTSANTFLNTRTLFIIVLGLIAFSFGTAAGVLCGKVMYKLTGGQVNPLIGSAGVSAVPMAARVSQKVGQSENPSNFLLMHAMGPNVAGVIGSAVAAGILINIFG